MVLNLQLHSREFWSLWASQTPLTIGKAELGHENGGGPFILLPLTSLTHNSVPSFFISAHLLYATHTELHPVSGAFTEFPGTGSLYTHCTLCSQHSPPSVSSARSFLLFLQTSLGHYFLSGAGTLLLRFRGPFPTYPMSLGSNTLPSTPSMSPDTRWVLNEYLFNEYITDKRKCPYRHSIHFPYLTGQMQLITKLYSLIVTSLSLYFSLAWITAWTASHLQGYLATGSCKSPGRIILWLLIAPN